MKKILITGANGQLGRALMASLAAQFEVIGTKIENEPIANPGMPLIQMDLTRKDEVKSGLKTANPEIIINTAAYTDVDGSEKYPEIARAVNTEGMGNLLFFSAERTKIIHISSDYVFDGENGPYRETDEVNPTSYYGKTKLWAEQKLMETDRNYLIFRPNVLYQSTTHDQASFFAWVYTSLSQNIKIKVVTDQTSNPTWVSPFTRVIRKSIENDLRGIYHYGSSDYLSRFDFAKLIAEIFHLNPELISPILTKELHQLAPRPEHSGLITEKIQHNLGVKVLSVSDCLHQIKNEWKYSDA